MPYMTVADFKARTFAQAADVDGLVRLRWNRISGDTSASSVTPETRFAEVVVTGNVLWMLVTTSAAVTHDQVNYARISVGKRTQGGPYQEIGYLDTSVTDLPAGVPVAIPVFVPGITAEDILTVSISKCGTGVIMPPLTIDVRPDQSFLEFAIAQIEGWIDARLRKRYSIPWTTPVPDIILNWETALVTEFLFGKRGFNPASEQDKTAILDRAKEARDQIKEAADSKDGLFDLPVRQGGVPDTSAITQGAPLGYSEQSPYVWADYQQQAGAFEDQFAQGQKP